MRIASFKFINLFRAEFGKFDDFIWKTASYELITCLNSVIQRIYRKYFMEKCWPTVFTHELLTYQKSNE